MTPFAVLIPMGPGQEELERVGDLLDSLWTYEPETSCVVVIDDDPEDKDLRGRLEIPKGCELVRLVNPYASKRKPHQHPARGPLTVKTLMGLSWIETHAKADFVVRLDTDALVIAPFAKRLGRYFDSHPNVAMTSCYKVDCNGRPRGLQPWPKLLREMRRPVRVRRKRPHLEFALTGPLAKVRRHIDTAVAKGYVLGESCFGGAMAVSAEYLRRVRAEGYLNEPAIWFNTRMADDVMLAVYARAVGMDLADMGEGEVFGAVYPGLPDSPQRLLERGFGIIHAVKGDPHFSEEEIRSFFQEKRAAEARAET